MCQKWLNIALFRPFLDTPEPQPTPVTSKTNREVEQHVICLSTLPKLRHNVHYSFQGIGYAENGQN